MANSYCDTDNVVAYAQAGDYTVESKPTSDDVDQFMEARSGELYALLRETMGDDATGPEGYATTIDTGSDVGLAMSYVLRDAAAMAAAADALQAAGASQSPARSERVNELLAMYEDRKLGIPALAQQYGGASNRSATHRTTGEVTAATIVSRTEQGMVVDDTTEF